ncbi:MAG: gliding motility-associated C-terminal domain-containing protein, partial [Bacteroidetes bacterium]|nr:gliding motility-associated C-terminal domain-containing protein [Bacteroidota bacterium]
FRLPGAAYLWNDGDQAESRSIRTAGTYWLLVTQQGCSSADTINVGYKPLPVLGLGDDTSLCENTSLLLRPGPDTYTYTWQDNSVTSTYLASGPGLYYVTALLDGCSQSDSITIRYITKPTISLPRDTMVCKGLLLLLDPGVSDAALKWQDGSTGPTFGVTQAGIYRLTATNQCGSSADSSIVVEGSCRVFLPNAFSPNDDGHNDLFRLKYPEIVKQFHILVYDRWGMIVFETTDPYNGWNGRTKGTDAPAGAYVWAMSYTDVYDYKSSAKGTVLLLR